MNPFSKRTTVLFLASLLAFSAGQAEETSPQPDQTRPTEQSIERAREANEAAAKKAAEAVVDSTRLDLDIRLIGPTSVKIAGER